MSKAFPGAFSNRNRRINQEFVAELAENQGLRTVEISPVVKEVNYYTGEIDLIDETEMYRLKDFLDKNKLEPIIHIEGLLRLYENAMENELKGNIEAMRRSKFLGARTVICFAYGSRSRAFFRMEKEAAIRLVERQLAKVAEAADGFGLRLALSVGHAMPCGIIPWSTDLNPMIDIVERTRKKTGLDNIGLTLDPMIAITIDQSITQMTATMARYTFHVYLKDAKLENGVYKGCIPGRGIIPWRKIVSILKDENCDAAVSLDTLEIRFPDYYTYLPQNDVRKLVIESFKEMRSLGIDF